MNKDKDKDTASTIQVNILREIKTPLRYFALAVLTVEGILGALSAKATGGDFTLLVVGMIVSLLLLISSVIYLTANHPRALIGLEQQEGVPKLSPRHDVFLSSPMAAFGNDEEYKRDRANVLRIMDTLKSECRFDSIVYAGKEINSVDDFEAADLSVNKDFQDLLESKYFVLLYPKKIASSVLVEAGWALALGKTSIYFVDDRKDLPFLLQEAGQAFSSVKIYEKCDTDGIINMIKRHRTDLFLTRASVPSQA